MNHNLPVIDDCFSPKTYSDEGKPVKCVTHVTQQRVEHYNDVIEYMIRSELQRCAGENISVTPDQIKAYRLELIRRVTIGRSLDSATKIKIDTFYKQRMLNEYETI